MGTFCFSWAPFGGLETTYTVHFRVIWNLVRDFLFVIIELLSLVAFILSQSMHLTLRRTDRQNLTIIACSNGVRCELKSLCSELLTVAWIIYIWHHNIVPFENTTAIQNRFITQLAHWSTVYVWYMVGWLIGLKANPTDHSVFSPHVCNCWCTQWSELHIRRPTGDFSWIMRLQNEPDLMAMFPDFALSDISNLFMPFPADEDPQPSPTVDTGELVIINKQIIQLYFNYYWCFSLGILVINHAVNHYKYLLI